MKIAKTSYAKSLKSEASRWTPTDLFVLELLAGTHSYEEIALRLGRTPSAVQRQASRKGLRVRASASGDRAARAAQEHLADIARLRAEEESLAEFVPDCDEPPTNPRAGSREYHRNYKRAQRAAQKEE